MVTFLCKQRLLNCSFISWRRQNTIASCTLVLETTSALTAPCFSCPIFLRKQAHSWNTPHPLLQYPCRTCSERGCGKPRQLTTMESWPPSESKQPLLPARIPLKWNAHQILDLCFPWLQHGQPALHLGNCYRSNFSCCELHCKCLLIVWLEMSGTWCDGPADEWPTFKLKSVLPCNYSGKTPLFPQKLGELSVSSDFLCFSDVH